jgi:hypothetical protein
MALALAALLLFYSQEFKAGVIQPRNEISAGCAGKHRVTLSVAYFFAL